MSRKIKYSLDFKLSLVKQVLKGLDSLRSIAKENGLRHSNLQLWVNFYKTYGIIGLQLPSGRYDGAFKLKAIQALKQEHLSLSETCLRFKIPGVGMLANWLKKYEAIGAEALFRESRGRPKRLAMSDTTPKKPSNPKTQEQELEEENKYLRAENAYLKKLYALIQKEEAEKKKKR
jgi:transposase